MLYKISGVALLLVGASLIVRSSDAAPAASACPAGMEPSFAIISSVEKFKNVTGDRMPTVEERYLACIRKDAQKKVSEFNIARVDQVDTKSRYFTTTSLSTTAYATRRVIGKYGNVLLNALYCKNCNWAGSRQEIGMLILHSFSVFGANHHDYRQFDIDLDQTSVDQPKLLAPNGQAFNVIQFEKGTWGVNRVRLSRCVPPAGQTTAQCLLQSSMKLVLAQELDLDDQPEYPQIAEGQTQFR